LFFAYGNTYSFGVFFPALSASFGADRAETALVFSIVGGLYSTLGIISGPAADRLGTRPVCLFGIVALGIGLIYASTATALWQVYLGFGLGLAFGMGFIFAPANAGLQRWFTKKRGLASGIASTGIGVSILVLPPVSAALIEWQNWRVAMQIIGVSALIIGSLAALMMGDPIDTKGGSASVVGATDNQIDVKTYYDLKAAFLSRGFLMLFFSSMICSIGFFIPFVHLVPYAIDQGFGETNGVYLLMVIGISSLTGRILLTAASDHLGRRNSMIAMYFTMALSFLLWYVAGNMTVLTMFAVFYGLGSGGYVAMIAPLIAEYFGTEKIGSILGCFMPNIALGGFFGPYLTGYAYDLWGSYDIPFIVALVCGLAAAVLALLMPARAYEAVAFQRELP
tara:strand:+ start:689 stop:1870 length:1182 start_codon:yes stop_codon:yes gene_type:complete